MHHGLDHFALCLKTTIDDVQLQWLYVYREPRAVSKRHHVALLCYVYLLTRLHQVQGSDSCATCVHTKPQILAVCCTLQHHQLVS